MPTTATSRAEPRRGAAAAPLRVLVMAHMHPLVSRGGAEIAAYQLYGALRARPGIEARFLAAGSGKVPERLGARMVQPFGPDEFVYTGAGFDHWIHANPDPEFPSSFAALLEELRPDIVHLHHYTNFGVEALLQIRRTLPTARIVLTLHEYLGICNHFGQMVKRPSFALCDRASPRDCARCFPERSEQDFFLRELYLKRFFRLVDHFISPSRFLADRYAAWGLDSSRIVVMENGMPAAPGFGGVAGPPPVLRADPDAAWRLDAKRIGVIDHGMPATPELPAVRSPPPDDDLVFGFFGQISKLKGIDVVLDAAALLAKAGVERLRIDIHGDHSSQPPEFRAAFEKRLDSLPPNVRFCGPYENRRVHALMRTAHAVLVPSIWWENSPLVIQEAFLNRRPVICSDIGGMAEKVRDGLDGFHFQAGSAWSLSALLHGLAEAPHRLVELSATLARPPSLADTAAATIKLYRRLLAQRGPERSAANQETAA